MSCKEIDHRDGKSSQDQWDDSQVSFGFGERIELMGENEEKGRVKISRILLIKVKLTSKIISRIIEGMDFVHPERFSVEGVESEGKAYEKAKSDDKNFFSFYVAHIDSVLALRPSRSVLFNRSPYQSLFLREISDPRGKDTWKRRLEIV